MMLIKQIARHLHLGRPCFAVEKALLAKLRKKTGYTFTNCKKALEMHENNLHKAEAWLKEQAQQLGWAKATKLEGRQAMQGLIVVAINNNSGTLLELNCETDFVAKNEIFKNVAELAATTVLKYAEKRESNEPVTKIGLDMEQLKQLNTPDGKTLGDHVALMIGTLGENATLKRAICLKTGGNLHLSAYAHPSGVEQNNVLFGKICGLVAFRQFQKRETDIESNQTKETDIESNQKEETDIESIGRNICQHIVGMDPKKIGNVSDEPSSKSEEEICLVHQEYLLDDTLTVKDVLKENGIEIVDFKRFECGETFNPSEQPLDLVETCQ